MTTGLCATFADYSDLAAYIKGRDEEGMTPDQALAVGDNGVGKWGLVTAQEHTAMVALSPEDYLPFGNAARGKKVAVLFKGQTVVAELEDSRPHKENIHDGTVIEANPALCKAFGLDPANGTFGPVSWEWA